MASLYKVTRQRLLNDVRSLETIAEETSFTYSWLRTISNDRGLERDPGVQKIQALYEYLTGEALIKDE